MKEVDGLIMIQPGAVSIIAHMLLCNPVKSAIEREYWYAQCPTDQLTVNLANKCLSRHFSTIESLRAYPYGIGLAL